MAFNFDDTTPSATAGKQLVAWQKDGSENLSGQIIAGAVGVATKTADYGVLASDGTYLLVMNSGSAHTFTLPGTVPFAGWHIYFQNVGAGTCTIAHNGHNIDNAAADIMLTTGQGVHIFSDGSNWWTERGMGSGGGGGGIAITEGTYASLPGSGVTSGDMYLCTDSPYYFRWNGSSWDAFMPGFGNVIIPPSSGWSWDSQASASVDQTYGALNFLIPAGSARHYWRSPANSAPYTLVAGITVWTYSGDTFYDYGVGGRKSSDGSTASAVIASSTLTRWLVNTSSVNDVQTSTSFAGGVSMLIKIQVNTSGNIRGLFSFPPFLDPASGYWRNVDTNATAVTGYDKLAIELTRINTPTLVGGKDAVSVWHWKEYNSIV